MNQKNRPYDDAYNAQINENKEKLHWYRTPTSCNINLGPDVDNINVSLKNDDNINKNLNIGYSPNNKLDRLKTNISCKSNNILLPDRFIDPLLIKQLESNPYNIINCT